jgi:hypothetical protein
MPRGYWTCQRVTAGIKCGAGNPNRNRKCKTCGKTRAARKRPAHLAALDQPYTVFLALNGGIERCWICGTEPGQRKLHRDHDHRTGEPRGLLCFRCNSALRPYMTWEWLDAAAEYLRSAPERMRAARRAA